MLLDTISNLYILTQAQNNMTYPGLLFSVLFFGGLSALLFSNYGMHPQISAAVLLLAIVPEVINIFVVHYDSFAALFTIVVLLLISFEPRLPKLAHLFLTSVAILTLQLIKLDELGTAFIQLSKTAFSGIGLLTITIYLVFKYFDFAKICSFGNNILMEDDILQEMKSKINSEYRYKVQFQQGDFLTSESFSPLSSVFTLLTKHTSTGSLEQSPIIRLYLLDNHPVIESFNVKISSNAGFNALNEALYPEAYTLINLSGERDGFVITPFQYVKKWESTSTVEDQENESEIENHSTLAEEIIIGAQRAMPSDSGSTTVDVIDHEERESTEVNMNEPQSDPLEQFRNQRRFNPKAGRSMIRIRNITKEEGTTEFQWNVPSK
jgi:hypothetical protein